MFNSKNFNSPILTENCLELTENRVRVEYFPRTYLIGDPPKDLQDQNIEPEHFEGRIIFISMFNDIDWTKVGNSEKCMWNSEQFKNYAKRFSRGHWSFLGPGDEKKWNGTLNYTPEGKWDSIGTEIVGRFKETGHPAFNWQKYHTHQCGFSEHRTLVSHNSSSKSAQYPRSSFKLVRRVCSTDSESKRVDHGEVRGKRKRAATEKCEAARSEFFGPNSKAQQSDTWKQIARMASEI